MMAMQCVHHRSVNQILHDPLSSLFLLNFSHILSSTHPLAPSPSPLVQSHLNWTENFFSYKHCKYFLTFDIAGKLHLFALNQYEQNFHYKKCRVCLKSETSNHLYSEIKLPETRSLTLRHKIQCWQLRQLSCMFNAMRNSSCCAAF